MILDPVLEFRLYALILVGLYAPMCWTLCGLMRRMDRLDLEREKQQQVRDHLMGLLEGP